MNPLDNDNISNINPPQSENQQQPNNQMLQQVIDNDLYPVMKRVVERKEGKIINDGMTIVKSEEEIKEEEERLQKEKEEKENEEKRKRNRKRKKKNRKRKRKRKKRNNVKQGSTGI